VIRDSRRLSSYLSIRKTGVVNRVARSIFREHGGADGENPRCDFPSDVSSARVNLVSFTVRIRVSSLVSWILRPIRRSKRSVYHSSRVGESLKTDVVMANCETRGSSIGESEERRFLREIRV
jgi:hypothetical protein